MYMLLLWNGMYFSCSESMRNNKRVFAFLLKQYALFAYECTTAIYEKMTFFVCLEGNFVGKSKRSNILIYDVIFLLAPKNFWLGSVSRMRILSLLWWNQWEKIWKLFLQKLVLDLSKSYNEFWQQKVLDWILESSAVINWSLTLFWMLSSAQNLISIISWRLPIGQELPPSQVETCCKSNLEAIAFYADLRWIKKNYNFFKS